MQKPTAEDMVFISVELAERVLLTWDKIPESAQKKIITALKKGMEREQMVLEEALKLDPNFEEEFARELSSMLSAKRRLLESSIAANEADEAEKLITNI